MVRRAIGVLALTLVFIGLVGCVSKPATEADVIGTWTSPSGGSLAFSADGAIIAEDVPRDVWDSAAWKLENQSGVPQLEGVSATGTWRLRSDYPGVSGQVVEITSEGAINVALVMTDGSLGFNLGDPDLHHFYVFNREDETGEG